MDMIASLNAIGFTEYEAKVYVALLKEHPATGYQLSKQAGIPRSMVYEALGRLDSRGAVLKTEEPKVTLYRPLPPEVLLDRLTDDYQQQIQVLRQGLEAIFTSRDEGHLWMFAGESTVLSYATNMIANARHEAMLVLTDENLHVLRDEIVDAEKRGVAIGALLTGREQLSVGEVAYHPPRESQLHKLADSLVVVVDEQEVLIASSQPSFTATVTTNDNMVQIGRQFVWMELFTHRILSQLGADLLDRLSPGDRMIFESVGPDPTPADSDD
jgi:sugar-specific transcriptional regulator TrmB